LKIQIKGKDITCSLTFCNQPDYIRRLTDAAAERKTGHLVRLPARSKAVNFVNKKSNLVTTSFAETISFTIVIAAEKESNGK
jgi:hypothetical protein